MENTLVNCSRAVQNVDKTAGDFAKKEMFSQMAHESQPVGHESRPLSQRVCPPDKVGLGTDILPSRDQTVVFSAGQKLHGQIKLSSSDTDSGCQADQGMLSSGSVSVGQLMRPRSPTRQCAIPEADSSHFSLALMESKVGSETSEHIFHVQEHELICAISSQTSFVDSEGCLVSSIDINYYWCNFCTFSTTTKTMLMRHVMEHRFHCKFCRYQSFSRADIIHHSVHMHPDFKETAATTRYCTLLSDYLRICHPKQSQLNCQRKRKCVPNYGDDNSEELLSKVRNTGHNSGKQKAQKKYSADYLLFDVDVVDTEQVVEKTGEEMTQKDPGSKSSSPPSLEAVREVETPQSMESGCASSCSILSTQSDSTMLLPKCNMTSDLANQSTPHSCSPISAVDQHSTQTSPLPVFPPDLMPEAPTSSSYHQPGSCSSSNDFSGASLSSTPSPPNLSSIGAGTIQQGHSKSEWTCAYCTFTCASQKGIRRHCLRQHRGKPYKWTSPIELEEESAPPLFRYDGEKISSGADQSCDSGSLEEKAFSISRTFSMANQETSKNFSDEPPVLMKPHSDEPPVLVKQNSIDSDKPDMFKVNIPVSHCHTKNITDLKCYHCKYRSQHLDNLRTHIFGCHKGKSLNGVDADNSTVFICSKASCTFRSCSGQSFLNHAQECIPWPQPVSTEFLQEPLLQCLQATTRLAEHDMLSSSSSFASVTLGCKESSEQFACTFCEKPFISTKSQVKQHVLECHGSKCLFMRNVYAHSKRKKSSVYFCRWCSWEGEKKNDHDLHSVFCPRQSKPMTNFSNQASNQASGISHGFGDAKKEEGSSGVVFKTNSDDLCMTLAEEHEGQGDNTHYTHTLPPVTSSADTSSEANDTVCNQECDGSRDTHSFLQSPTADDKKCPADTLSDHELEDSIHRTLSLPELSTADDSSGAADQFLEAEEHFDLTLTHPGANIPDSYFYQTDIPRDIKTREKGTLSAHFLVNNTSTAHSDILPDIKSFGDSMVTSDTILDTDTVNAIVKTETPDISTTSNKRYTEFILPYTNAANDNVHPPSVSAQINIDGSSMPQDSIPPDISSVENRVCSSPPDISFSGSHMDTKPILADLTTADSHHSMYSTDTNPVKTIVDNCVCAAEMTEDISTVGQSMYPTCTPLDIKINPNSTHPTLTTSTADMCSGFSDRLCEQGREKEHPVNANSAEGSSELADTIDSLHCLEQHGAEKPAFHFQPEGDPNKDKDRCAKAAASRSKKLNIWRNGCKIECFRCSFYSDSLASLKAHIHSSHSQMVSFPFRSVRHRDMHYKCIFFACPSLECMVYNYSESSVVSHYRQCHSLQPHPYVDPSYVPAPGKSRRRTNTEPRESRKNSKLHTHHLSKVQTESKEQTYMCLYCEQKIYTDTVSEMKVHHLSCHMGQPITIRNVNAHRERRTSRFFVCDQPRCDFCTYDMSTLDKHMQMEHSDQLQALADRSYQCVACGWITSEYGKVQNHVSVMHESEGGATVVTLAHGDEQSAIEERFIVCIPGMTQA